MVDGPIAGICGVLIRVLRRAAGEQAWRLAFLAGLVLQTVALDSGPIGWQARPATLALA